MNNAVGYAPTAALRRAALGTDGMDGDMLAEARAAYLKMREAGRADAMDATLELLAGGHRLAAALFGLPFGKLDAGGARRPRGPGLPPAHAAAPPRTWAATCCSAIDRSHVRSVMVAGRWVVRDRRSGAGRRPRGGRAARTAAAALWARMATRQRLESGSPTRAGRGAGVAQPSRENPDATHRPLRPDPGQQRPVARQGQPRRDPRGHDRQAPAAHRRGGRRRACRSSACRSCSTAPTSRPSRTRAGTSSPSACPTGRPSS